MKRLTALSLLFFILVLPLSGCWDSREVTQMAIVTLMGIDRVGEDESGRWSISARVMHSTAGPEAQVSPSAKGTSEEVLFKGEGRTLQEAIVDFTKRTPKFAYFGHITAIVIGERAAKEGVLPIIELQMRYREARPRTLILVAKGDAFSILESGPEVDRALSKEIKGLAENKISATGIACGTDTIQFAHCLLSPDKDPAAPIIQLIKTQEEKRNDNKDGEPKKPVTSVVVQGQALFNDDKLVGWLNKEEAMGFVLMVRDIRRAQMPVVVEKDGTAFSYLLGNSKHSIKPRVEGGKLFFTIKITTYGQVDESGGIDMTGEGIKNMEKYAGDAIRELALKAIERGKENKTDPFGFCQELHRKKPKEWKQVVKDWREGFCQAEINIEVNAKIVRTGRVGRKLDIRKNP